MARLQLLVRQSRDQRVREPFGVEVPQVRLDDPAELVAERIRQVLKYVPAERLSVTPDCGFSQTARHVAVAKARALAEGARIVRRELGRGDA